MIHLMHKMIDPDSMPVLYDTPFTAGSFAADFEVRDGNWFVEDGWLIGENRRNSASMALLKESFYGPVCLDFKAKVLPPCTHDINCMWSGSWNEETNRRALAYVAVTDFKIRRAVWEEKKEGYEPEF